MVKHIWVTLTRLSLLYRFTTKFYNVHVYLNKMQFSTQRYMHYLGHDHHVHHGSMYPDKYFEVFLNIIIDDLLYILTDEDMDVLGLWEPLESGLPSCMGDAAADASVEGINIAMK